MRARGFTLVEALVVVAIVLVMAATAAPAFRALFADEHVLGAGRQFKSQFRLACSAAVRSGVYTAIRFERREHGTVWYAAYQDGDQDGVRSPDIADGKDTLLSGPFPLSGGAPGVTVGINPGVPALPPEARPLSGDPARFGSSTSSPSRPSKRRRRERSTWPATPRRPPSASPAAAHASASWCGGKGPGGRGDHAALVWVT